MARRRFFVPEFRNQRAELAEEAAHHLVRVLRVEAGQRYELSDGASAWLGEVAEARKSRVVFSLIERLPANPLPVRITLLAALIKFDHFEWVLEKGTECGVERFIPVVCERSEKGLDRAVEKRRERWERILVEASQQCRRDAVPELGPVMRFTDAVAIAADTRLLLDEACSAPILRALPEPDRRMATDQVAVLVGPEGGWADHERELAVRGQWTPVSLGGLILRAETAAVVASAIVGAAWRDSAT